MPSARESLAIPWLAGLCAVSIALCIGMIYSLYDMRVQVTAAIRTLQENQDRLLEKQTALRASLQEFLETTKESQQALRHDVTTTNVEVQALKSKLEPVKAFIRSGEIVLIE